jgi:hypothetical protein
MEEKFSEINFCYLYKFSEKYNSSERISPETREENVLWSKIVGASEKFLK